MNKQKIALISHVNPFISGSGQHQRVFNTLLALAKNHENLYLYTINEELTESERLNAVLDLNNKIKIEYVKQNYSFLNPFFGIYFYLGLGKKSNGIIPSIFETYKENIKKENFDIIIFEYWYLFKLAKFLKTKNNKVFCDTNDILSNTFTEYLKSKKTIPKFYKKILLKKYKILEFKKALTSFDVLIAINKNEEIILKQTFPNKEICYVPMGVKFETKCSISDPKPNNKTTFEVCYYGGLGFKKNSDDAIRVFNEISKIDNDTISYKIIGSNPPQNIKNLKSKKVAVVGYVENLELAFKNCDLAVIPFSGKYGFRSRIIELMYYGVPVLTTNDAVWGMGFTNNENIFIIKNENNFSLQISKLLLDNELRNKIAKNAQQKVLKEFTFEETYDKFSKIINLITIIYIFF